MYNYINGIISEIESDAITVENQGIGYLIHTASPYSFKKNDSVKIYIYQYVKEDEMKALEDKKNIKNQILKF